MKYLPGAIAWVGLAAYVVAADETLARLHVPVMTSTFRALRRTPWGKPVAYGALAGLTAHLLDLP